MFSRIAKVALLLGCLAAAGSASAYERSAVVPAIAGAVVGVLLVSAYADAHDDHPRHDYRQPRWGAHYSPRAVPGRRDYHGPRHARYVAVPIRDGRHEYRHDRRH